MTLRLSYFVPPTPLLAARKRGYLDEIDLVETRASGSPAQLAGLLAGELDVVVTAIDNLFGWVPAGAQVRLVGQVEATTSLGVYADAPLDSLAALSGRTFAVDAFANGFALVARHLFLQAGITVDYVEVGGVKERLNALLTGAVAATLLGPPFDTQALAAGRRALVNVQEAYPSFPGQGLVVRTDLLGSPEVEDLLAALRSNGLLPVDAGGFEVLTTIRRDLGLLPDGVSLSTLV